MKVDHKVGDKVEVYNNKEGFMSTYYEGTIVSCIENGKYVVHYKNLFEYDKFYLFWRHFIQRNFVYYRV
jgi:hypothetical protein